jgi:lipid-binding SYLF domain-containing protein
MKLFKLFTVTILATFVLFGNTNNQTQQQVVYQEVTVTPKDILKVTQDFYNEFKGGQELLKKAEGYLVFPTVYDAGLVVGGKYGYGAMVQNNSIASYYKVYSTSVGLKAGVQKFSMIVVFLTKESLRRFLNKEEWKVSLDSGLTFTSWKQGIDINTLALTKDTIVIPFNDVGLMANISFEGTVFQKLQ